MRRLPTCWKGSREPRWKPPVHDRRVGTGWPRFHCNNYSTSEVMTLAYGETPQSYTDPDVLAVNRYLTPLRINFCSSRWKVDVFPTCSCGSEDDEKRMHLQVTMALLSTSISSTHFASTYISPVTVIESEPFISQPRPGYEQLSLPL